MKKLIPLIFLIFLAVQSFAQNWQCIPRTEHPYYINSFGYLRSIRIDSVRVKGTDTVLYPYRSLRGNYLDPYPVSLDSMGGSWMGKTITIKPDGTHYFEGYWGDTVIIKSIAELGDSWILYDDTTGWHYDATVTALDTMTIASTLDSIKTIAINAYNKTGVNNTDPLNNKSIILSKNFGLVQTPDLYMFPLHKPDTMYSTGFDYFTDTAGPDFVFKRIELLNPLFSDIYSFDTGDTYVSTFQVDYTYPITTYTKIVNKSIIGGTITYTQNEFINNPYSGTSSGTSTFTVPQGRLFDTMYVPEEYGSNLPFYFFNNDSDMCVKGTYRLACTNINGTVVNSFEPYLCNIKYKLGLGKVEDFSQNGSGGGAQEKRLLVAFYKHGNPCSLSVKTIDNNNSINIYPNPASDEIQVQLPLSGTYNLQLYNAMGQSVKSKSISETALISVADMASGIYYVTITDGNGISYHKQIVISH